MYLQTSLTEVLSLIVLEDFLPRRPVHILWAVQLVNTKELSTLCHYKQLFCGGKAQKLSLPELIWIPIA